VLTVNFKMFKIEDGDIFLDAGCGEGRHSYEACRHNNHGIICAMDVDYMSIKKTRYVLCYMDSREEANGNWNVLFGDALNLPFKDASFDKIICSEVLEHVKNEEQGIMEFVRVLKPGGALAVTVPTYLTETVYWALDEDYYNHPGGHVRIFTAKKLIAALRRNNLAVCASEDMLTVLSREHVLWRPGHLHVLPYPRVSKVRARSRCHGGAAVPRYR
jgi:SAM-dependent methyltransferase